MQSVTLYTTHTCVYCTRAKVLLTEYGVTTPVEFYVDTDSEKRAEMIERTGERSVPQIFIGETYVGGFDALQALHHKKALKALLSSPSAS